MIYSFSWIFGRVFITELTEKRGDYVLKSTIFGIKKPFQLHWKGRNAFIKFVYSVLRYSATFLVSSSVRFWLSINALLYSFNKAFAIGSSFNITSGFIIIFITHSGLLLSYTPFSAGPIIRCSAMWQAVQIAWNFASPAAAISVLISESKLTEVKGPTPLLSMSTGTASETASFFTSFLARFISKPSFFSSFFSPQPIIKDPTATNMSNFRIVTIF